MPKVWIVMGNAQVGKSSAIRALTGVYRSGRTDVQTVHGRLNGIFVQVRSLQEKGISPQDFISARDDDEYILLALRVNQAGGCPNGLSYMQAFTGNNWMINRVTVLGTDNLPYNLPQGIPNPLYIRNSGNIPANQTAHRIRNAWDWL